MVALLDLADIQDAKIDTPARLLVHSAQQIRGLLVGEDEDNLGSREITFTYPENPQGEKTVNITARIPYSSRLFHSNGGFLLPSIKPIEAYTLSLLYALYVKLKSSIQYKIFDEASLNASNSCCGHFL